ncbi:hypothetical protein BCR36DRAFT_276257, partial [Piromyces finnis]
NAVHLQAIACNHNNENLIISPLIEDFSTYSKNSGLNITLSITFITLSQSNDQNNDYISMIDFLFSRKSNKYDLYFFDAVYSNRYSPFLENLDVWLPSQHLEIFNSGVASKYCLNSKNQFISLVNIYIYSIHIFI